MLRSYVDILPDGDGSRKTESLNIKWKMSLGVKNESNKLHDSLPIRFPVCERKIMTDGVARRKVSRYPKSNESHPLGNSSYTGHLVI